MRGLGGVLRGQIGGVGDGNGACFVLFAWWVFYLADMYGLEGLRG